MGITARPSHASIAFVFEVLMDSDVVSYIYARYGSRMDTDASHVRYWPLQTCALWLCSSLIWSVFLILEHAWAWWFLTNLVCKHKKFIRLFWWYYPICMLRRFWKIISQPWRSCDKHTCSPCCKLINSQTLAGLVRHHWLTTQHHSKALNKTRLHAATDGGPGSSSLHLEQQPLCCSRCARLRLYPCSLWLPPAFPLGLSANLVRLPPLDFETRRNCWCLLG